MADVFGVIKGFFVSCFAFIFSLSQILAPTIALNKAGSEDAFFDDWSASQTYTADYAQTIEKDPDKDFVILNITDVQLSFPNAYSNEGKLAENTIDALITSQKPDLITVTGDNAWSITTYLHIIEFIDSYGIPWAPIMGNHDGQGCPSEFWCAYLFTQAENCLFKMGPKGMGYGNYIINITENGKIVHTLFMMDTHSDASDTEAGKINAAADGGGYDHLWANQIEWYKWAVNGIKALNSGKTVESTVFIHIPCCEYVDAMKLCCNPQYDEKGDLTNSGEVKEEYKTSVFGVNHENICCPPSNNGFFSVVKELGSTKNIIAGHDHVNSLSCVYQGVRLSYGVKCGSGCYWEEEMNGGSVFTIDSNGNNVLQHVYVDPDNL